MVRRSHLPQAMLLAWLLLAAARADGPSEPRGTEDVWAELGTNDPAKAEQLTTYLVARPGLALPLLRKRLQPVPRVAPGQLNRVPKNTERPSFTRLFSDRRPATHPRAGHSTVN